MRTGAEKGDVSTSLIPRFAEISKTGKGEGGLHSAKLTKMPNDIAVYCSMRS